MKMLTPKCHLVVKMLSAVCDTKKDFKTNLLNRENMKWKEEAGVFNPSGRGVNLTAPLHLVPRNTGDRV